MEIAKLKKQKVAITISVLVGLMVSLQFHRWLTLTEDDPSEPRFLVARRDLEGDSLIQFQDFGIVTARQFGSQIPQDALTDQDWHRLQNARVKTPLKKGDLLSDGRILWNQTSLAQRIPRGKRAYSFTPAQEVRLNPGDHIDIFLTPSEKNAVPQVILEDVLVLQLRRWSESISLILALSSQQIQILERGGQLGNLSVALRNREEGESTASKDPFAPPPAKLVKKGISIHTEAE